MKKGIWILSGFFLFLLGASALVLSFVGVHFVFLQWLELPGPLVGFLLKLLMIIAGIIIMYLTATDWREQEE